MATRGHSSITQYDSGFFAVRSALLGASKILGLGFHLATATALPAPIAKGLSVGRTSEPKEPGVASLWVLYTVSAFLVLLGGAFAGLTIALMGQDSIYLQVLAGDRAEPQRRNARRVHKLLQRGKHWVLVTLLLSNVIVNETLPVVLDRCLGGGVQAVIGSTVLIVIFGEVIPQSLCVRYGLPIGGFMAKSVLALMYMLAPVAWPTAKLLDWLLGQDHGTIYKKSGLKTLVTLHKTLGDVSNRLNQDEVTIISAVLDLKDKPVSDVMTPMNDVFIMSEDTILDEEKMDMILSAGYSRIPIHRSGNETNFVGMLLVKILITYDPEDCKPVRDLPLATLPETRPETSCLDIINYFQEGKSHMMLVSELPGEDHGALGVVTLEDVIEELIGEEIVDESDVYIDVHKAIRRLTPAPRVRSTRRPSETVHASGYRRANSCAAPSVVITPDSIVMDKNERTQDKQDAQHIKWDPTPRAKTDPHGLSSSPKPTTFLMRKSSIGSDGQSTKAPVPVRANINDMKEHLRHLGPSNPATNPKSTRSVNVKIKSGQRNSLVAGPELAAGVALDENEETRGLLPRQMTDATRQTQNYGSANNPISENSLLAMTMANQTGDSAVTLPAVKASGPTSTAVNGSHATQTSSYLKDSISGLFRRGSGARSGSITENVVESGGVQKIVVGVVESNFADEDDTPSSTSSSVHDNLSSTRSLLLLGPNSKDDGLSAKNDSGYRDGQQDPAEGSGGAAKDGAGQGRKRCKKKKPNKSDNL